MASLKVVFAGPALAGKTTLANFLADATDVAGGEYHPTKGVRILEFSTSIPDAGPAPVEVQLWDCSGDPREEVCWPAIARDTNVLFLVLPIEFSNADAQFLETLFLRLGAQHGLKESKCTVLVNASNSGKSSHHELPQMFSKVRSEIVTLERGDDFKNLFSSVISSAMNAH